jgi:cellulose synthase/poly-beta-1,6-N-acetylglucosamine synthase-like glycosyltransferase
MDLVLRIRRRLHEQKIPFRIGFIPDPVCWTQAPESWKSLLNQRNRWQRGLIQVLQRNAKLIFNPRYGVTGMFALPFYLIFEMLSPLIEIAGYAVFAYFVFTGNLNGLFALRFFFLAVVLGTLLSLSSIILEEFSERRFPRLADIVILFVCGVLENLGYRQVLALVRAKGFLDYLQGKNEWGAIEKKKFKLEPSKT